MTNGVTHAAANFLLFNDDDEIDFLVCAEKLEN